MRSVLMEERAIRQAVDMALALSLLAVLLDRTNAALGVKIKLAFTISVHHSNPFAFLSILSMFHDSGTCKSHHKLLFQNSSA